mmetsp:Transcript_3763/g.7196  ORF Transcript_3763/g.7196 Transcript_3763/m.7196 type:complete len:988 (-) Transcript_3763:442-3405(-)
MVDEHSTKAPRRRGRKGKKTNKASLPSPSSSSSLTHSGSDHQLNDISFKPHKTLLIHLTESTPTWYECGRGTACRDDTIFNIPSTKNDRSKKDVNSPAVVAKYRNLADSIFQHEVMLYKNASSNKDEQWVENTMKKGTLKDRIAAMAVVVSTNPVHKLYALDMLLNLVGVSTFDGGGHGSQTNERVATMAAEALTDLFVNTLLPKHRKLLGLESRPLFQYEEANDDGTKETKRTLSPRILLLWRYEEIIKSKYAAFISQYLGRTLSQTSTAQDSMTKVNALRTACQLLTEIPEGEQILLDLIVNKIGDPTKKIASAAAHELRKILDTHPNMTRVIAREVQQLAHRPNLSAKALYNCIIFLNQLKLVKEETAVVVEKGTKKEISLPTSLINTYFQIFEFAVNKSKVSRGDGMSKTELEMDQAMKSRLLGALLTGVNRAHPYLPSSDTGMEQHIDSLYRIAHVAPPSACTQALLLLFHLAVGSHGEDDTPEETGGTGNDTTQNTRKDRFYRALYSKVADPTMLSGRQLTLYFNLVYKAMKYDTKPTRVVAFGKRLLHTAFHSSPAVTSGALFLVSEVMKHHPELSKAAVTIYGHGIRFDPSKREPAVAFSSAGKNDESNDENDHDDDDIVQDNPSEAASLWEISLTLHHFHPSVCKFSQNVGSIEYDGDPLKDFTLAPFLDKFAFRNPKSSQKIKNKFFRRETIGERRSGLQATIKAAKSLPINDPAYWTKQKNISEDDDFYYKFFVEKAKRDEIKGIDKSKKSEDDVLDLAEGKDVDFDYETDEEEEKFVQGLAEDLMRSKGERIEYDDEDPDMDDWSDYEGSEDDDGNEMLEDEAPIIDTTDDILTTQVEEEELDEEENHTDDDDDEDDDGMKFMYINNTNASSDSNSENEDDLDLVFAEDLEDNDDNSVIANSTNEKRSKEGKSKKIPQSSFADSSEYEDLINKAWEERRSRKRETFDENDEIDDKQPSKKRKQQKKRKHKKDVDA